jgi:hypothetical protein
MELGKVLKMSDEQLTKFIIQRGGREQLIDWLYFHYLPDHGLAYPAWWDEASKNKRRHFKKVQKSILEAIKQAKGEVKTFGELGAESYTKHWFEPMNK